MLELINFERTSRGLNPVQLELRLNDSAEDHSLWMLQEDVFSHTGIGGSSPGDRIAQADFQFSGSWSWAENIAWQSERGDAGLSDDVENLHAALMNSAGHRANILNPDMTVVGIGIERGNYNGWDAVMVTQNFARTSAALQLDIPDTPSGETTSDVDVTEVPNIDVAPPVTSGDDKDVGSSANDTISGGSGADLIRAGGGNDHVFGGAGPDRVFGQAGDDTLRGQAGQDRLIGGTGADRLFGGGNNDVLNGGSGKDRLLGEGGNDKLFGGGGADRLIGSTGSDWLYGQTGRDILTGGGNRDTFVFRKMAETANSIGQSDLIRDFRHGIDKIDLHGIDASNKLPGNNAFQWDGTERSGTDGHGEVHYRQFDLAGRIKDFTMIYLDTDGDSASEAMIRLSGLHHLTAGDFIL